MTQVTSFCWIDDHSMGQIAYTNYLLVIKCHYRYFKKRSIPSVLVMIMNMQEKRGLISLIAGCGVIAILIGIFSDVEFGHGLVVGVAFFILSGAVSTLIGLSEDGETLLKNKGTANARRALVTLIAGFGVIILLSGIFVEGVDFSHALIVAVAIFILSGVVASFLGVSDDKHCGMHYRQRNINRSTAYTTPVTSEESTYKPKQSFVREDMKAREKESLYEPQITKKYCHSCGVPMNPEDDFCYNCGAKSSF